MLEKKRADRQIESCVPRDSYRVLLDYLLALLRSYRFRSPFGGVLTETTFGLRRKALCTQGFSSQNRLAGKFMTNFGENSVFHT